MQKQKTSAVTPVPRPYFTVWRSWELSAQLSYRQNFLHLTYNDRVRTSQETHYVSATKLNRLMLFGERVAVYSEHQTEHTNKMRGQNAEFQYANAGGIYSNHWV
jgi:hypothetical protein